MAFSESTKIQAKKRAGNQCECGREVCGHTGRCNAILYPGTWHAHHRTALDAGGSDDLSNCEALCIPCHENTGTYGRGS